MSSFRRSTLAGLALAGLSFTLTTKAQTAPDPQAPSEPPASKGTVLFQSHGEPPSGAEPGTPERPQLNGPGVTDAERAALTFTVYDLDARLTPASARLAMRAHLTLRNDGKVPLSRIALQISSTLTWESATLLSSGRRTPLALAQHLLDTDADHTGKASEAILTLSRPLAPGASVELDTFYSGPIGGNAGRLTRIGATAAQASDADWDGIAPGAIALRGFGNVLWYPVAASPLFLGDGAKLFQAVGQTRLREQEAAIHLRVAVEFRGEPPVAVYFCGRRQALKPLQDDADAPIASGAGIATAEFAAEPLGFRLPSLFIVEQPEILAGKLNTTIADEKKESSSASSSSASSSSASLSSAPTAPEAAPVQAAADDSVGPTLLAVETTDEGALPRLAASAESLAPLLQRWFGARPLSSLTVLDHAGQPFEDGPLLVAPIASLAASTGTPALAHSLTHAWMQTGQPWMDEGLAQFVVLLQTEQERGLEAALAQLNELVQPLVLAEPGFDSAPTAQPASTPVAAPRGEALIAASDEIYYRRKGAAVWWMLRGIVGDDALREALTAWSAQPLSHESSRVQATSFEHLLEKTSRQDLAWFFNDWVLHDRGLPDLSIVDVTPRLLSAGKGHDSGWLVAVTVRNDGAAAADVPVVIRSGTFSTTKRLRIAGFESATERVIVEAAPTEVLANDGGTPEVRTSLHSRKVVVRTE